MRAKVFCIGLSRTGTTSLTQALRFLGLSAVHFPTRMEEIRAYDAASDLPVAASFRQLDATFPNSKFILTLRGKGPWLESCRKHWLRDRGNKLSLPYFQNLRKQMFGCSHFDRGRLFRAYDDHEERVDDYFKLRPDDLLKLDIFSDVDAWMTLCLFLERPIPEVPFPKSNETATLDILLARLIAYTDSIEKVSRITTISEEYLRELSQREAAMPEECPMEFDLGSEYGAIVKLICDAYGLHTAAEEILGIGEDRLLQAYARSEYVAKAINR